MNKKYRRMMTITVIIMLAIMLGIAIFKQDDPTEYEYEEITVQAGDTFWQFYQDGYYADVCYSEALYEFKKDNSMDKYSLNAGDKVVLRKVVVENEMQ